MKRPGCNANSSAPPATITCGAEGSVTRKGVYRVVSITEGGRQCFSDVIATDGASERRLHIRFNTPADAEATVAYLKRSIDRLPSPRKAATAVTAHLDWLLGLRAPDSDGARLRRLLLSAIRATPKSLNEIKHGGMCWRSILAVGPCAKHKVLVGRTA